MTGVRSHIARNIVPMRILPLQYLLGSVRSRLFSLKVAQDPASLLKTAWRRIFALAVKLDREDEAREDEAKAFATKLKSLGSTVNNQFAEHRDPVDEDCERLVADIEALGEPQKIELIQQVDRLWGSFLSRFGGIDGFLEASSEQRNAYYGQLKDFAERYSYLRGTPQEYALLSVQATLRYTSLIGRNGISRGEKRLSTVVVDLIHRAKALEGSKSPPVA